MFRIRQVALADARIGGGWRIERKSGMSLPPCVDQLAYIWLEASQLQLQIKE